MQCFRATPITGADRARGPPVPSDGYDCEYKTAMIAKFSYARCFEALFDA